MTKSRFKRIDANKPAGYSLQEQLQAYTSRGVPDGTGCLIYPTNRRYPMPRYYGRQLHFGKWVLISRGIDDSKMVARHTCDKSRCVNPDHIIAGTVRENMYDLIKRGSPNRILRGDGRAQKLTQSQIIEMRKLYKTGEYTQRQLAKMFGVASGSVCYYLYRYVLDKHTLTA